MSPDTALLAAATVNDLPLPTFRGTFNLSPTPRPARTFLPPKVIEPGALELIE